MPDPLTLLSGAMTLGSGVASLFGKKQSFKDTEYGKMLKQLANKGMDISQIMGGIGSETGNVAAQAKTALKGNLISQGMGGSIAGQSSISNIDVKRMDQLQRAMKDLQTQNEQLKMQYGLQYAQAGTEFDMAQQQQQQGALGDLFGVSGSLFFDQMSQPNDKYKEFYQKFKKYFSRNPVVKEETLPMGKPQIS
jgi:hypothetical protein